MAGQSKHASRFSGQIENRISSWTHPPSKTPPPIHMLAKSTSRHPDATSIPNPGGAAVTLDIGACSAPHSAAVRTAAGTDRMIRIAPPEPLEGGAVWARSKKCTSIRSFATSDGSESIISVCRADQET